MCETSEVNDRPLSRSDIEQMRLEIAWRVHEAFDFRPDREIACMLKTSCCDVEKFIDGRELPSTETLLQIHAVTGVSLHWLLTGEGSRSNAMPSLVERYAEDWADLGLA